MHENEILDSSVKIGKRLFYGCDKNMVLHIFEDLISFLLFLWAVNYIWLTLSDLIQHFVSSVIMQNSEYMEIYFAAKVSVFLQYPPKLIAGETFKKTCLEVPLEAA